MAGSRLLLLFLFAARDICARILILSGGFFMKKILLGLLCLAFVLGAFSGCGGTTRDGRLKIVATSFPEYDWVREILGTRAEEVELVLLLDKGVDLHSYQPTAQDLAQIASCDLFLHTGQSTQAWVTRLPARGGDKQPRVICLMELLGDAVKSEEIVEGMQSEQDHDHEHEHEEHDHEHEAEQDEHIWLSLQNAATLCRAISGALCELDRANQALYTANTEAYLAKLEALDAAYRACVDAAARKTLLFGDRFPFRYLAEDYQLEYYAAFAGCSAETEASFETITFLAKKVDELQLPCVLTIEGTRHRIAQTVVENTSARSAEVLVMNSMQSVTAVQIAQGVTYLLIMQENLAVLQKALG